MIRYSILFVGVLTVIWSVLACLNVYYLDFSFQDYYVKMSFAVLLAFLCVLVARYLVLIYFSYLNFIFPSSEKKLGETPLVSIIVPAHNEEKGIEASIKSLLELTYPYKEIIIVDDGSTDDTLAISKKYDGIYQHSEVKVISQVNKGKAAALNTGIANSGGKYIVCVDADSILEPDVIEKMIPHFEDAKVGAVAGNIKVINTGPLLTKLQSLEYIEGLNMVRRSQGFFKAVNIIPGPLGIFRRSALEGVGGYDSDTFAEDCDLTIKLLARGWGVDYEPEAIAWTEAPEKIMQLLVQRYRWARGILQSLRKHRKYMFGYGDRKLNTFTLWYMSFEALVWPSANIFAQFFFIFIAFTSGMIHIIIFWWIQLTLLDMIAALHCVLLEKESLVYVPYAIIYRFFFILIIDVCKVLATIEEMLGVEMVWGHIERMGRIHTNGEAGEI
jgi:poly-beta-1,6 N-acetyl-D-glucosamine synthase